ncbi:hypothetical protein D021_1928B, partial [Vibrio parahaemolyticus 10296]
PIQCVLNGSIMISGYAFIPNKLVRMIITQCCTYNKIYVSIRLSNAFVVKVQ